MHRAVQERILLRLGGRTPGGQRVRASKNCLNDDFKRMKKTSKSGPDLLQPFSFPADLSFPISIMRAECPTCRLPYLNQRVIIKLKAAFDTLSRCLKADIPPQARISPKTLRLRLHKALGSLSGDEFHRISILKSLAWGCWYFFCCLAAMSIRLP